MCIVMQEIYVSPTHNNKICYYKKKSEIAYDYDKPNEH